jgi:hypothetical protein
VPLRGRKLSRRNLSYDDLLEMVSVNQAIALGKNHWTNMPMANAVINPVTGKDMQDIDLMKDPVLRPLWKRVLEMIKETNTSFFDELTNIPKDRQITYGKKNCDYKPHKKKKERVWLTVGGDIL